MAMSKGITDHAPRSSWWAEEPPDRFYARARQEYKARLWKMRTTVQSFEAPSHSGRMSQPSRNMGAE